MLGIDYYYFESLFQSVYVTYRVNVDHYYNIWL